MFYGDAAGSGVRLFEKRLSNQEDSREDASASELANPIAGI